MKKFDPIYNIENSNLILDNGKWPTFHDAVVHKLLLLRGDVRPKDNVFIQSIIEASFEINARNNYIVILRFHDCGCIKLENFSYINSIQDLIFSFEASGVGASGCIFPPRINVHFQRQIDLELSFNCLRIQAVSKNEINNK